MIGKEQIIDELKHLIRYFYQASHEFFDETSGELTERIEAIQACLDRGTNSIDEYAAMIEELRQFQVSLKKKTDDLGFLVSRMEQLFER